MHGDLAEILAAIEQGDTGATDRLLPLVYDELRAIADRRLANERPGQTLQATALVHEAYLRLIGPDESDPVRWNSRGHFFAAAAEAMRRILIDRARARGAAKRGGGAARRIKLDPDALALDSVPDAVLDLDDALQKLARAEPDKAQLVKLRFYGGLTLKQAAGVLAISPTTANRDWVFARAWLYDELSGES